MLPFRLMCALFLGLLGWVGTVAALSMTSAESDPDRDGGRRLALWDDREGIDAWPAVRVLIESDRVMSPTEALSKLSEFKTPTTPRANLGSLRKAVWMHVPVQVPASESGQWIFDMDYPPIDQIRVAVFRDGRVVQEAVLGDHLLVRERPLKSRSHWMHLNLAPGQRHELLLRVESSGALIVPVRLMKQEQLDRRESTVQVLQGVAAGICLCLIGYALAYWHSMRDVSFLYSGLSVAGIAVVFFGHHGLGSQHLWADSAWMTRNMAILGVFPASAGALLFLNRTLLVRELHPRLSYLMRFLALVAFVLAVLFIADLIDYQVVHLLGSLLGPASLVLALPAAWFRARQGDRAARYILVGWGLYGIGVVTMAALMRGFIEYSHWTNNSLQLGSLLEMAMWMRVLGMRQEEIRHRVERATREREALRSLAQTDALTGLPNRRGLDIELSNLLSRSSPDRLLAVYLLDLDGFKAVNDRLGHDIGDALLKAVSLRLQAALRARDVVARLGGDEFVVLVPDLPSEDDAMQVGQKLVRALDDAFALSGHTCKVGVTVGYAMAPPDGTDATRLLKIADAAMYVGKKAGRHCVRRGAASFRTA